MFSFDKSVRERLERRRRRGALFFHANYNATRDAQPSFSARWDVDVSRRVETEDEMAIMVRMRQEANARSAQREARELGLAGNGAGAATPPPGASPNAGSPATGAAAASTNLDCPCANVRAPIARANDAGDSAPNTSSAASDRDGEMQSDRGLVSTISSALRPAAGAKDGGETPMDGTEQRDAGPSLSLPRPIADVLPGAAGVSVAADHASVLPAATGTVAAVAAATAAAAASAAVWTNVNGHWAVDANATSQAGNHTGTPSHSLHTFEYAAPVCIGPRIP
jgi:hypothetical protein